MSKVKNPCKFCFKKVTYKNGFRCSGTCMGWVHFKCLNYSQEHIKDAKSGKVKAPCPCPECLKSLSPVSTTQVGSPDTQSSNEPREPAEHKRSVLDKPLSTNSVTHRRNVLDKPLSTNSVEPEEPTSTRRVVPKTVSSYGNEIQVSSCHHNPGHSPHSHSRSFRNESVIRTYVRDQSTQDGERYMLARRQRQGTPCECRPKKNLRRNETIKYVPLPLEYNRDYDDRDYEDRDYVDRRIYERTRRSEPRHKHSSSVRVVSPGSSADVSREPSADSHASNQSNRTMILALEEMYKKVKILSEKIHSLVDNPPKH